MMETILRQGLASLGLDPDAAQPLSAFAALLEEKNRVMNLTAITAPEEVATRHFLDCLSLLRFADFTGKTVVDVGTGAGFPGVPLKIAGPTFSLTLLDSLGKRVDFLRESCAALGLRDVVCVHQRAEEFAAAHRERYDFAVSRAVADLRVLSELCLPLVKTGGQFLAMKSVETEAEIAAAKPAIALLGGKIRAVEDYTVPGTDLTHRLVIIDKLAPTPAKYPRAFAKIKKQPL